MKVNKQAQMFNFQKLNVIVGLLLDYKCSVIIDTHLEVAGSTLTAGE